MQYSFALFGALAVLPAARCIAFGGPAPTLAHLLHERQEYTPVPTKAPSAAKLHHKRIFEDAPYDHCGWIDGDEDSSVTCYGINTCMLYTASGVGMAGCCSGFDRQDCGWVTGCVDYADYTASSCDSDCMVNTFVTKCSNSLSPYCASFTYPFANVKDYACRSFSSSFFQTIEQSATDTFFSSSTSVSLTILSGSAVTGWDETDGGASATSTYRSSYPTSFSSSSSGRKKKFKPGLGLIIGLVIVGLLVIFVVVAGSIFFCMKKKKARQLAANQQLINGAQANRQSQYNVPVNMQPMQQAPPPMPMPPPSQHGTTQDYYGSGVKTPSTPHVQEVNPKTQSMISNPHTPAPAYVQPYYAGNGSYEADSRTVATPPPVGQPGPPPAHQNGVYEIGHTR